MKWLIENPKPDEPGKAVLPLPLGGRLEFDRSDVPMLADLKRKRRVRKTKEEKAAEAAANRGFNVNSFAPEHTNYVPGEVFRRQDAAKRYW
jgi:hypothetical protein